MRTKKEEHIFMEGGRRILSILASFVIGGLILVLLGQWLVFGCLWEKCADSEYYDPQEIQIPREYFPDVAIYGTLGPDHNRYGAIQHHVQQIFWGKHNNSTAILEVYRYSSMFSAKRRFGTEVRILRDLFNIPEKQTVELKYQSNSADEFFLGCGEKLLPLGYRCVFVALYERELIVFNMNIDEQMTISDFERIMIYLETIANEYLSN